MPAGSASLASRTREAYNSTVGKKAVMAFSGLILFGFLVGHLLGNLQVFEGAKKFDDYAHFLHSSLGLLWGTRTVLLVALLAHVKTAIDLELLKGKARAVPYQSAKSWRAASLSSRTMIASGVLILVFVVFHLLHFTIGAGFLNTSFQEGQVYHNVVTAFRAPVTALAYVVAMGVLGLHLAHGVWSFIQSLGIRGDTASRKRIGLVIAAVLAVGFASIPLAILAGMVTETAK